MLGDAFHLPGYQCLKVEHAGTECESVSESEGELVLYPACALVFLNMSSILNEGTWFSTVSNGSLQTAEQPIPCTCSSLLNNQVNPKDKVPSNMIAVIRVST